MAQRIGKAISASRRPVEGATLPRVNVICPKEYWDYEFLTVQRDKTEQDDYEMVRKAGRGKCSEVFEEVNTIDNEKLIIKFLVAGLLFLSAIKFLTSAILQMSYFF